MEHRVHRGWRKTMFEEKMSKDVLAQHDRVCGNLRSFHLEV